jgi:hypothetical protein
MTGYRIKVVLLTLGVVLGFGSAIARHQHWHHGGHAHHDCAHCWGGWGPWEEPKAEKAGVDSQKPDDPARPADR